MALLLHESIVGMVGFRDAKHASGPTRTLARPACVRRTKHAPDAGSRLGAVSRCWSGSD